LNLSLTNQLIIFEQGLASDNHQLALNQLCEFDAVFWW